MFKNALVSVSDKTGLVEFLKPLVKQGLRVVSTGGTSKYLSENGIKVVDVSEQTGFPEVMGGRVKTLHPFVHMGLLANLDKDEDRKVLENYKLQNFDLVIVNLYPFEETLKTKFSLPVLIEKIDVGGPSMLRAAAKNHKFCTVVCDPNDYSWVQEKSRDMDLVSRQKLAAKVFAHTAFYDSLIASTLSAETENLHQPFSHLNFESSQFTLPLRKNQKLRYGENPHQKANWYSFPGIPFGFSEMQQKQGKELSYNNLLDLEAGLSLNQEFADPVAVAVKHNNPCGVGLDKDPTLALKKALTADPVSVFGGIIIFNRPVRQQEAMLLNEIFLECVLAPSFDDQALEILSKKKNLRILESEKIFKKSNDWEVKTIFGGVVIQNKDSFSTDISQWKVFGPFVDKNLEQDILFGEKICGSLKSNSIALVKNGQSLGLGMGQVNRVDAVEQAIKRMKDHHPQVEGAILISDAFFPFPDSVEIIARSGIKTVVQPGGSLKDQEVLSKSQELGLQMVLTGTRHFRH